MHDDVRSATTTPAKINDEARNISANGLVVEEMKGLLRPFKDIKVVWVRRAVNNVAHELSREDCRNELRKTRFQVPPDCINSVVTRECAPTFE